MTNVEIPVLVINLDANPENWARVVAQLGSSSRLVPRRIPGVPGSTLPQLACDILTKTPGYAVGRGTLGVFMAHLAAWEAVAACKAPFCLVLEDDAELLDVDCLADFVLPSGIELAFCNTGMLPSSHQHAGLECLDIAVGLRALVESSIPGPGAYGYLLTPAGAHALLEAVRRDLCFGHLDWRLLRYCVTEELVERTIPGTRAAEVLHKHHHWERPAWGVVSAGVLSPALVRHFWTPSRRVQQDTSTVAPTQGRSELEPQVVFESRKTTFHIDNPADHIQSFVYRGEFYQASQLAFHRDLIPMGSTVIDVGANIGNHTLFYAKYTWAQRVYPLEPNPRARALLLANVAANRNEDCRAEIHLEHVAYAIGQSEAWLRVVPGPANNLGATILQQTGASEPDAVHCLPLDKLSFEGPVAFLKIDTEGMELDVLRGAEFLIAWHRPMIAIEVAERHESAFWQWCNDHRYQIFHVFTPYIGCRDFLMLPIVPPRPRLSRGAAPASSMRDIS